MRKLKCIIIVLILILFWILLKWNNVYQFYHWKGQDFLKRNQDFLSNTIEALEYPNFVNESFDCNPNYISEIDNFIKNNASLHKCVTFAVFFTEYDFYKLQLTVESILKYVDAKFIKEIIIVNVNPYLDHINLEAENYVEFMNLNLLFKVKYVAVDEFHNMNAKNLVVDLVESTYAIFIESNAFILNFFFESLLYEIARDKSDFVVPFIHDIDSFGHMEIIPRNRNECFIFDNSFNLIRIDCSNIYSVKKKDSFHTVPIMPGVVYGFIASKLKNSQYLLYDSNIYFQAASQISLSLRSWQCGKGIIQSKCSNVAAYTHELRYTTTISNDANILLNTVLKSFKNEFYSINHKKFQDTRYTGTQYSIISNLKCKSFDWYHSNHLKNILLPKKNTVHIGILVSLTNLCLNEKLILISCNLKVFKTYNPKVVFEYTAQNQIKLGSQCLTIKKYFLEMNKCLSVNGTPHKNQTFVYSFYTFYNTNNDEYKLL
ncbi:hypothetical protein A3Q56_03371 [Intoshia linei]|uniref:Uncharacterized protein n=1 Tax=Intoshia linei TaxID=1819745 RepID=A0A177B3J1_9BILA|nr:hypothetical protein A3Q56_03371 [Intoshia linei]